MLNFFGVSVIFSLSDRFYFLTSVFSFAGGEVSAPLVVLSGVVVLT